MAVYTQVSPAQATVLLGRYDLGALVALEGIPAGIENSNYRLTTEIGHYVLTLFERRVDPADLPYFCALTGHLAGRGLPVPRPIADRKGRRIAEIAGRKATIVPFLEGSSRPVPSAGDSAAAGAVLARLHVAGRDFTHHRANGFGPASWPGLVETCAGCPQAAELRRAAAALRADWPAGLPGGHIHGDYFPDNVLFGEGTRVTGVLDFYFAARELLAYDLAIALQAWAFSPAGEYRAAVGRALIAGYGATRPLVAAERSALPRLAAAASLRFALTRLVDRLAGKEGTLGQEKDPEESLARLRFFLAADAASLGLAEDP